MEKYKLMMFGFGIKLRNMGEVRKRLSQIPTHRGEVEGVEQCYLVDLESGEKYQIIVENARYVIKGLESSGAESGES